MDTLSDILKVVKFEGALFFNAEFSAPWCLHSRLTDQVASVLSPSGGHLIIYHLLVEGRAYAKLENDRREELTAGDIVIFPHGNPHYLGNGWPAKPVDSFQKFAKNLTEGLRVAHFGGGGEITRFVCGFMACERRLSEVFLAGLPPIVKVHVGEEPSGQWIENSIRFSAGALDGSNSPGSALVQAKLSEVMFVETLRRYLNALPADQIGWLAATRDPLIGQALALIHKDPAHQWTVADLARSAGLSRTRLSERFRHFLGESPMAYVGQWRLKSRPNYSSRATPVSQKSQHPSVTDQRPHLIAPSSASMTHRLHNTAVTVKRFQNEQAGPPFALNKWGPFIMTRTILLLIVFIVVLGGSSRSAQTPLKKLTTADLQKLRWIEGNWRGSGVNQPPFFERYRFESDAVLVVDSFADEKLAKVTESTRFELKDGEFGGGNEGARYAAGALDENSITFLPVLKVRNSFVWKRENKDAWTAIIRWPGNNDKPAGERIYNMVRIK